MKNFRNYLLPFVKEAKAFYAKDYESDRHASAKKRAKIKLEMFDDLCLIYEKGFRQALKIVQKSQHNFYQNMRATENRVLFYVQIKEREQK